MMNNEQIVFIFIFLLPILVVAVSYFLYHLYLESNKKRVMIDILSDSSGHILDKKKRETSTPQKDSMVSKKLKYGGFNQSFAEYIFIFISIAFGVMVGFFMFIVMNSPVVFIIATLVFAFFPLLILNKIIGNRQEEFNFGLKGVIDKVTSMMKSGVGFEQAFKKSIITSKSKFTQEVLGIYIKEKDIIGEDKSFEKMFTLVESKELRIFYLVISIGRQSGGKFSNTLEILRKTLQDQGTIKQEITSSTKEIKIGTYMIIALTVGIFMMIDGVFDGGLTEHFFGSDDGKLQMFFIVIWVAFGIFVNNMMTKIKD